MLVLCSLLLIACSDDESTNQSDVIDRGLAAIADNDLGKAEGIFESAEDNEQAQAYYEQLSKLRKGIEQVEDGEKEKGKELLEQAIAYKGGSKLISELAKDELEQLEKGTAKKEDNVEKAEEPKKAPVTPSKGDVISDVASGMKYLQLANEDGNIRAQASIDSKVVHSGKKGDTFIYLQEKVNTPDGRTWYKVEFGSGSIGYVSRAVATLTNETPPYVRLTEAGTNIRSTPSINASVIYVGNKNDTFYYSYDQTYTKDGRTWLHVWLPNGEYGYVSQKVATLTTAYSPTIHSSNYGSTLVITADSANIRMYPSIDSGILVEGISRGETFFYTGYSYNTSDGRTWYEVEVGNTYGYISKAVGKIQ